MTNRKPIVRLAVIGGATAVVALSGLSAAGAAEPAARHAGAPSAGNIARTVAEKLAANEKYAYAQLTLAIPALAGKGVSAEDAAITEGLRLVLLTAPGAPGKTASSEVAVDYKSVQLAQLRSVGGNFYARLNTAQWSALPLHLSKSTTASIEGIDVAFGERWLELPASALATAEKKLQHTTPSSPVMKELGSPAALEQFGVRAATGLLAAVPLTQSPAAGHNLSFAASGSLASLAASEISALDAIAKGLGEKPVAAPKKAEAGTYTLHMSTGGAGAYLAGVTLGLDVAGQGSLTLRMSFSHLAEPFGAPPGAKLVPSSLLGSL